MDIDLNRLDALVDSTELPSEFDGLPVFAVGGAVRDMIRGADFSDVDLMVAEVTPEEMSERGFTEIDSPNNDTFAVFLDSLDREVAIAREERSTGDGHTAFEVVPVPADVGASEAVERDLKRRDITVNSMALDLRWGVLHDPHNGLRDLREGIVRATNETTFFEDPLRILRAARFAARLDFSVEMETQLMMEEFADRISTLPGERIRMEIEKTFKQAETPRTFFDILFKTHALTAALPELDRLGFVPAGPEQWHKEGSAFEHTMLVLEEMHDLMPDDEIAHWMALLHDVGKKETPRDELPNHRGHGKAGLAVIDEIAERLALTTRQRRAAKRAARHHMRLKNPSELNTTTLFDMWKELGEDRDRMIRLMVADARGRDPPGEFDHLVVEDAFQRAQDAVAMVQAQDLMDDGHSPESLGGKQFGDLLRQRQVEKMRELAHQ